MEHEIISNSPAETMALGEIIGSHLKGGEVIAFCGPLGSGKTHIIKGIIAGAGAEKPHNVTSPTFIIINEYTVAGSGLDIYHIDAYRLDSTRQLQTVGFDELFYPHSVVLVEWADKVSEALDSIDCVWLKLSHIGRESRLVRLENLPPYIDGVII